MILLLAILVGLLLGVMRAWLGGRKITIPNLKLVWIVPLAFLPQFFAFQLPVTRTRFPEQWIPLALIVSQLLLLGFAVANLRQPGFKFLTLGLLLNLTVIMLNGGWMPISPETIANGAPDAPPGSWEVGSRLGMTKDKILPIESTRLWWLSDRFLLPDWSPYRAAFSLGDLILAIGAIWFFWSIAGSSEKSVHLGAKLCL